jgi:hypothetical protein
MGYVTVFPRRRMPPASAVGKKAPWTARLNACLLYLGYARGKCVPRSSGRVPAADPQPARRPVQPAVERYPVSVPQPVPARREGPFRRSPLRADAGRSCLPGAAIRCGPGGAEEGRRELAGLLRYCESAPGRPAPTPPAAAGLLEGPLHRPQADPLHPDQVASQLQPELRHHRYDHAPGSGW